MKLRISRACIVCVAAIAIAFASAARAEQPVGWRTDGTGRYPTAKPVAEWAKDKNVVWATSMPATGNATPVVVGKRIFVCAEPASLVCVSADKGEILWTKANTYADVLGPDAADKIKQAEELGKQLAALQGEQRKFKGQADKAGEADKKKELEAKAAELDTKIAPLKEQLKSLEAYALPPAHGVNGYTSATPVSDGQFVCAVFGNGVVACYDLEGNRKWARMVEKPKNDWGSCASPTIVDGMLIVHIVDLVALEPATGKEIWRAKSRTTWGSELVAKVGAVTVIITPSGQIVRASDGKVLATGLGVLEYNSPVVAGNVVYFIQGNSVAWELPADAGDKIECKKLWAVEITKDRYYGAPLVHDGLLYAITQTGVLSVLNAATGELAYKEKVDLGKGTVYPSATLGGDKIFLGCESGTMCVIAPGREFKMIASNTLEKFRACPVFVGDKMYLRGLTHLYCIGAK